VGVDEKVEEELSAPLSFFVEVSSYTAMTNAPLNEQELTYKKFQGVTLTGAARTHHQLGQGQWS